MIKVVKGNVVLRVEDNLMDFYVNKGFTAKSLDGTVIKEAIPSDADSLKKAYFQLKKENDMLKEEIATLKAKPQQSVVSEDKPIVEDKLVSGEKPKRTRRKSTDEQ